MQKNSVDSYDNIKDIPLELDRFIFLSNSRDNIEINFNEKLERIVILNRTIGLIITIDSKSVNFFEAIIRNKFLYVVANKDEE